MLCQPIADSTAAAAEEEEGANGERGKQASKGKGKGKRKRKRVENDKRAVPVEEGGAVAAAGEGRNRVWDAR